MINVTWRESVTESAEGLSRTTTQTYTAAVLVSLTDEGPGAWSFTGRAQIGGTFTLDQVTHADTPLGPCDQHFTDNATAAAAVDIVEGGLEASDGFYQFTVSIPGFEGGSNNTVRDDSGCFGSSVQETTPWGLAPTTEGGSGEFTDPNHISGSHSEPRQGGEDTVTWDFTTGP